MRRLCRLSVYVMTTVAAVLFITGYICPLNAHAAGTKAQAINVRSGDFEFRLARDKWKLTDRNVRDVMTYQSSVSTGTSITFVSIPMSDMKYTQGCFRTCIDFATAVNSFDDAVITDSSDISSGKKLGGRPYMSFKSDTAGVSGQIKAGYYFIKGYRNITFISGHTDAKSTGPISDVVKTAECVSYDPGVSYSVRKILKMYRSGVDVTGAQVFGKVSVVSRKRGYIVLKQGKKHIRVYMKNISVKPGSKYYVSIWSVRDVQGSYMNVDGFGVIR